MLIAYDALFEDLESGDRAVCGRAMRRCHVTKTPLWSKEATGAYIHPLFRRLE